MFKDAVHYGGRSDPSFRCGYCGAKWLLPQTVRWSEEDLAESARRAREAGWLIMLGAATCPNCGPSDHSSVEQERQE